VRRLALGVLVAAALGAAAATATVSSPQVQGDEVPIIVRDGSMIIETDGTFTKADDTFRHNGKGIHKGNFWVKVVTTGTSPVPQGCQGWHAGKPVVIRYSDGFAATFAVDPTGTATTVSPGKSFKVNNNKTLEYGQKKDKAFIQSLTVGQWSCTFPDERLDRRINICSSDTRKECR
jgi:hypothetical protein